MNKIIKKIIASFCIGVVSLSVAPATAMADTIFISDEQITTVEITPRWTYISDIVNGLSISGTTAYVTASTEGFANQATKAKIIVELQYYSSSSGWLPIKIWTVENENYYVQLNETYTVNSGSTYRVKVTATVWVDSASETQTTYSLERTAP